MHEESLVRSMLDEVVRLKDAHGATRVSAVWVEAGPLSGIEPELFRLAFERLAPARIGVKARLEMTCSPLALCCMNCQSESRSQELVFRCSVCGSQEVTILEGDRLILDRVELASLAADESQVEEVLP